MVRYPAHAEIITSRTTITCSLPSQSLTSRLSIIILFTNRLEQRRGHVETADHRMLLNIIATSLKSLKSGFDTVENENGPALSKNSHW